MAQDFEPLLILVGDNGEIGVAIDDVRGIDELAVDLRCERGLGEAGSNRRCYIGDLDRFVEGPDRTVRQANIDHEASLKNKKCGRAALFSAANAGLDQGRTRLPITEPP